MEEESDVFISFPYSGSHVHFLVGQEDTKRMSSWPTTHYQMFEKGSSCPHGPPLGTCDYPGSPLPLFIYTDTTASYQPLDPISSPKTISTKKASVMRKDTHRWSVHLTESRCPFLGCKLEGRVQVQSLPSKKIGNPCLGSNVSNLESLYRK